MSTTPTTRKPKNFKQIKVLDCFMGGGTTLVEGSRLGFQMSGVDLNPVAWFVVPRMNSPASIPTRSGALSSPRSKSDVKPQIQPFYVTEEPDHTPGKWFDVRKRRHRSMSIPRLCRPMSAGSTATKAPEAIYTFWAKHGPLHPAKLQSPHAHFQLRP